MDWQVLEMLTMDDGARRCIPRKGGSRRRGVQLVLGSAHAATQATGGQRVSGDAKGDGPSRIASLTVGPICDKKVMM